MVKYIVETLMLGGFENCWTDDSGEPQVYDTLAEAKEAIAEHINDCYEAVNTGDLTDAPVLDDFRIVEAGV